MTVNRADLRSPVFARLNPWISHRFGRPLILSRPRELLLSPAETESSWN